MYLIGIRIILSEWRAIVIFKIVETISHKLAFTTLGLCERSLTCCFYIAYLVYGWPKPKWEDASSGQPCRYFVFLV